MKSHPLQKVYAKHHEAIYLHSEVDAIKNAVNARIDPEIISKSTLYICRQKIIHGEWVNGLAKPCSGCKRCIAAFGISAIVYTLDDFGYAVVD